MLGHVVKLSQALLHLKIKNHQSYPLWPRDVRVRVTYMEVTRNAMTHAPPLEYSTLQTDAVLTPQASNEDPSMIHFL